MNAVFVDTFYYLALLNPADAAHSQAVETARTLITPRLTTSWILTEVADALAASTLRHLFVVLLDELISDPRLTIVPASQELFLRGTHLYGQRADKNWSLTDCISFVTMRDFGISEALTGDHHFEQAGYRILFTS